MAPTHVLLMAPIIFLKLAMLIYEPIGLSDCFHVLKKLYPYKLYSYNCISAALTCRAEMQVATTQDYATNSWFWTVFTGALNHQTTHHLFPGIIQSHYPKITPILAQTCKDFGITYHYVDTTREALSCHIDHLKKLGQGQSAKKEQWKKIAAGEYLDVLLL